MIFYCHARRSAALIAAALLASCAQPPLTLPGPVNFPRSPRSEGTVIGVASPASQRPTQLGVSTMPASPQVATTPATGAALPARPAASGAGVSDDVSMAIEQTPLPIFIQILYGNVLKKAYSLDPAVSARTDMVTFKTSQPISRARMEQLAVTLLRAYQLSVQDFDGLVRITPDTAPSAVPPMLRRGKSLPETPEALRPAFQYFELDVVRTTEIIQWVKQILGNRINIQEDTNRNGFLMSGTQSDLRMALDLIESLDQPRLRGRVARRISPAYMNTSEFSTRLSEVLTAQGYAVSNAATNSAPILLLPIASIGSVVVFTNTESIMEHVLKWARELDRPLNTVQTNNGLYTYAVKYADAQELARTLGDILGGGGGSSPAASPAAASTTSTSGGGANLTPQRPLPSGGRVVVNSATNTLIIRGTTADEYQQMISLLRELDRPVKSAMIEVVVAELSLGGSRALGIEWNVPVRAVGGGFVSGGTQGGLGIGSAGFNLSIANGAGQIIGMLNTLASNNQAKILSNPKVMARNGETASIQVGQEVPIITSQQSSGSTGGIFGGVSTGVLQTVQYRSTGVILKVRPVINSGNRLDLEVSQEVSSAAETRTGVSASPTISTRSIQTKLSLRDGSTVLLGGLISRTTSDANTGIPFLKDIPGLGALFKTQSDSNNQTELLVMITPYVVGDDFEAEAITEAIQKSFGDWAQDIKTSRVMQPGVQTITGDSPVVAPDAGSRPAVTEPVQAPMSTPTPAPMPSTSSTAVPAANPTPATRPSDADGVTMSRPPAGAETPAAASGTPAKPAGEGGRPSTDPASPAGTATPGAPVPKPADPATPTQGGKPVTDPKVLEEIRRLLQQR